MKKVGAEKPLPGGLDPEKLRLSQDFGEMTGVKKLITTVPVRWLHRQYFIRVHPDEGYSLRAATLEVDEDRDVYVVDPAICNEIQSEKVIRSAYYN